MASAQVKVQVFTDFDGTLNLNDTGLLLIDDHRSMGPVRRREIEHLILDEKITYKEGLQEMWNSVHLTWEEAWSDHLDHCTVDPGFPDFNDYCRAQGFPITIVSSGLYPIVSKIMTDFLGDKAKDIEIISNDGKVDGRNWTITYRDDSPYGNDKSRTLKKARDAASPDTVFVFCGDGVSDISAAKHADVLFARKNCDLETYCVRHNIPFIAFDTFKVVHDVVQKIAEGKAKIEKDPKTGFCKVIDL